MQERASRRFHVGIIMDGNGRWAEARGLSRVAGPCARRAAGHGDRPGLPRPRGHPPDALRLLDRELAPAAGRGRGADADLPASTSSRKMEGLRRNDVRVRFIGMRHRVPPRLRELMEMLEARTARLPRPEPVDRHRLRRPRRADPGGARAVARGGRGPARARRRSTRRRCRGALDTRDLPDPDFIIRTSGELRISNFLLWQGVYAEYDFPATAWPDFTSRSFAEAIEAYQAAPRAASARSPSQRGSRSLAVVGPAVSRG